MLEAQLRLEAAAACKPYSQEDRVCNLGKNKNRVTQLQLLVKKSYFYNLESINTWVESNRDYTIIKL